MTTEDALNVIKNLANIAMLPNSTKRDHMIIAEAIETIEKAVNLTEEAKV